MFSDGFVEANPQKRTTYEARQSYNTTLYSINQN